MNRRGIILGLAAAIVLWPVCARADVGTPLIWAGAFHLFLGNAIIGLFEGLLLARVFHLPRRRCIGVMIVANYVSAWIGLGMTPYFFRKYGSDIYSGLWVTWLLVFVTYLVTLVVEWPFVALCLRKTPQWFARSIKASLVIQSASYLLLFGGYWLLSGKSLYTEVAVVAPEQIPASAGVVMFYISGADGDVYQTQLGSTVDTKIARLGSTNRLRDHLVLKESKTNGSRWDLAVNSWNDEGRVVVPDVASMDQISDMQESRVNHYYGWGSAFQVGGATNSDWHLAWAHWPDLGMWARNGRTTVRIAYGTPFGGYVPYRVIHLPGDKAILQLDDQICLVDLPGKKIARIRKGYGMLAFEQNQLLEPGGAKGQPVARSGTRGGGESAEPAF